MATNIKIKRAYDPPDRKDGLRVLVDRLWPRGLKKEDLEIDLWMKGIAPSDMLRKWFSHDPERWDEFKSHYFEELHEKEQEVDRLLKEAGKGTVTLVYASKEERLNNAVALREYMEEKLHAGRRAA